MKFIVRVLNPSAASTIDYGLLTENLIGLRIMRIMF